MKGRVALIGVAAAALVCAGLEVALLSRETQRQGWIEQADRRKTQMVDRLVFTDTADTFAAGTLRRVSLVKDLGSVRVVLDGRGQRGFPREGTWTSPETKADFPFTELVPSWNVAAPDETGVVFTVRTRDAASGEWTPWLRIGGWGRTTQSMRVDQCKFGRIDIDQLFLNRPADAYQVRATLQSFVFAPDVNPSVRRIAVSYSGQLDSHTAWARPARALPQGEWARTLDVPFIPQGDNAGPVTGMTCSPTSVSMVLRYWGVERETMENCLAIWDDHNDLFGNWSNATQRAAELGLDAWLQRFRNWDQVKELIARGQPVVASIRFGPGTFPDSPVFEADKGTDGHLIVIRGFTPSGDVVVNDPASRTKGNRVVYPAKGLAHAWFGNGGVGYVIRPPATPIPAALVKGPARLSTTLPSTAPVAATGAGER